MRQPAEVPSTADRRRRLYILGVLWLCIALVLVAFRSVVLPFAGAALIAYLVQPLVARITQVQVRRAYVPRWVAILTIYAAFFLGVYLFSVAIVPQLYREMTRISREGVALVNSLTPERIEELAQKGEAWLGERGIPVELSARALEGEEAQGAGGLSLSLDLEALLSDTARRASTFAHEHLADIVAMSRAVIVGIATGIFMLFFILMVAAFFSIDAQGIRRYFHTLVPPEYVDDAVILARRIDRSLAGVVRGQVTICVVNGALTFIGLMLFGVKFAFLLATVATFLSLIPIFGTIISSVPIVLIALSDGFEKGVLILLWIIGIHALEAYFLNPKIMGSAARIHPVIVAFSLIAGERTFGLVGALFAVPIAAILVACFDHARERAQPPVGPALAPPPGEP